MTNETKRVAAFFLVGLIMMWWMTTQSRSPKKQLPKPQEQTETMPSQVAKVNLAEKKQDTEVKKPTVAEQSFTLENDDLRVQISSFGGFIEKVDLKKYGRELSGDQRVSLQFDRDAHDSGIHWQMTLNEKPLNDRVVFTANQISSREVQFSHEGMQKIYRLDEQGYSMHVDFEWRNQADTAALLEAKAVLSIERGSAEIGRFNHKDPLELAAYANDKLVKQPINKDKPKTHVANSIPWAGVMDRYFLAAMIPIVGQAQSVSFGSNMGDSLQAIDQQGQVVWQATLQKYKSNNSIELSKRWDESGVSQLRVVDSVTRQTKALLDPAEVQLSGKQLLMDDISLAKLIKAGLSVANASVTLEYPSRTVSGNGRTNFQMDFFMGPKEFGLLEKTGAQLENSVDLGAWIGVISRPILKFMNWIYGVTNNYGVAIILLTFLVRLLLYPLTVVQYRSMKRMQLLKPQIDQLREKYADKKEELNKQMLGLFRTHKVNPMGGCLPMVVQMPIFFALYRVLYNAIELRHTPFVFWLQDLSAQDPYYVTPLLLGVTMFFQQKLTPVATMDPSQAMMMKVMPVMFTVFMLWLPSGLTLYIFISTLLGLLQQWVINRQTTPALTDVAA